jgi:N-acetylneuraminic acid mutarotase
MMKTMLLCLSDLHYETGSRGKRLFGVAVLFCLLFAFAAPARSQSSEWAWMGVGGSDELGTTKNAAGELGTSGTCGAQGTFNNTYTPGSRTQMVTWTDNLGYLWLFGGQGFDCFGNYGYLNDLWKYDPWKHEWALMSATQTKTAPTIVNQAGKYGPNGAPGSRSGAVGWLNIKDGTLWLFGGLGYATSAGAPGPLNDLWEFDPSTATPAWTYAGGRVAASDPGTYITEGTLKNDSLPGSRYNASSWTDRGGNFWLYGGQGATGGGDNGNFNDLWEYDPVLNEWGWMGGSSTGSLIGTAPVYPAGAAGTPSINFSPGSRFGAVSWTDNSGNFWLFGGQGPNKTLTTVGSYNDLWMLTPGAYQEKWAYMGGQQTNDTAPVGDFPRSRWLAASWNDGNGKLWLFGGEGDGYTDTPNAGYLEFLDGFWSFNPSSSPDDLDWASPIGESGSDEQLSCQEYGVTGTTVCPGEAGLYTALQQPAPDRFPGSRNGAASWTDSGGNLWLFGGYDFDVNGSYRYFNDLWKYQPYPQAATPTFNPVSGSYPTPLQVTISDTTSGATIYYTTDGSTPTPSNPSAIKCSSSCTVTVTATETLTAIATASGYTASNSATATYTVYVPAPAFNPLAGTYNQATVTISDATPGATIYYTTDGLLPTTNSTVYSFPISITTTTTLTAIATSGGISSLSASATYIISSTASTAGEWAWMAGSESLGSSFALNGSYSNAANQPSSGIYPGSRMGAVTWNDSNGNLWLFGGGGLGATGSLGTLNDLWEFNPSTDFWAWMGGTTTINQPAQYGPPNQPSPNSIPGGLVFPSGATDLSGNFWLFGGAGLDVDPPGGCGFDYQGNCSVLNNLWSFQPSTVPITWTFVDGAKPANYGTQGIASNTNIPGARESAATWIDNSGNLWLFGGEGFDSTNKVLGPLNDLWMFSPAANAWTWISGGTLCCYSGVYGQLGTPSITNSPGGRSGAAAWKDSNGNLWLFGGNGFGSYAGADPNDNFGPLNDLWMFNPTVIPVAWTYVSGSSLVGRPGVCVLPVSASCTPGGRMDAANWADNTGGIWLFGGVGLDANGVYGSLDDLWEYSPTLGAWQFVAGSSTVGAEFSGPPGVYGIQGQFAAGNHPGGRSGASSSTDTKGNFWLFGGEGEDMNGKAGVLNDLWELQPPTAVNPQPYVQTALISPGAFTLIASPVSLAVTQGASITSNITVYSQSGFNGNVILTASGLPSGVTASFSPNPATGSSVLTLTASNTAVVGSYKVTITGTSGPVTAITVIPLTVNGFACHIGYTIETQWPGGFEAAVNINNTGTVPIGNWTLTWSFANGQKITELWDGNATQSGANVTVTNASYDGNIPAGGSFVGVGFNGTWNNIANAVPASFAINGITCK